MAEGKEREESVELESRQPEESKVDESESASQPVSETGATESAEPLDTDNGSSVPPEARRGSQGFLKIVRAAGFLLLAGLLGGSLYFLRDLSLKLDVVHAKLDDTSLSVSNTVASARTGLTDKLELIQKSIVAADGENAESLKKILIFLGDLRFKIKELEKKIGALSVRVADNVPGTPEQESGEEESVDTEIRQESTADDSDSEELFTSDPVDLIQENSEDIRELDEAFIGELVDDMIVKRMKEYDLSRKEEALKKKSNELAVRARNEKLAIAIEDSAKKLFEGAKNALTYCEKKIISAYEFLTR